MKRTTSRWLLQSKIGILKQRRWVAHRQVAVVIAGAALAFGASAWFQSRAGTVSSAPIPAAVEAPVPSPPPVSEPSAGRPAAPDVSPPTATATEPAPLASTAILETSALPTPVSPSGATVSGPAAAPGRAGRADASRAASDPPAGRLPRRGRSSTGGSSMRRSPTRWRSCATIPAMPVPSTRSCWQAGCARGKGVRRTPVAVRRRGSQPCRRPSVGGGPGPARAHSVVDAGQGRRRAGPPC